MKLLFLCMVFVVWVNGKQKRQSDDLPEDARPPVIMLVPVNITVAPGGTGEFSCTAEGAPTPQTTITKKDETSAPDLDAFKQATSSELQSQTTINAIANVDYPNEGWYTCQACNRYGCAEHNAYLHVLDLCAGVVCSGDKYCKGNYEAGSGYTCACPSYCEPHELFKFDLVCSNYCEVRFNECEMYTDACNNDKYGVALLNSGSCAPQQAPVFVEGLTEEDLLLDEGDYVVLECDATGLPQPEILWWKGGELEGGVIVGGELVGEGHVLNKMMSPEDAGIYTCQAMNCKSTSIFHKSAVVTVTPTPTIPPTTSAPVVPDNIVIENPRSTCAVYGDPHFETFDGSQFDYMGKCDSVLAIDCSYGSWFVYGRMRPCGLGDGSCLESVTIYVLDEIIELQRGWLVNRNGKKVVPKNHPHEEMLIEGPLVTFSLYFDGSILRVSTVLSEETIDGVTLTDDLVLLWDGYVSLEIQAPRSSRTCGICGNNDGDSTNDMKMRRGGNTPDPTTLGDSWNIGRGCEAASEPKTPEEVCGDSLGAAQAECARIFNTSAFELCELMGHEKDSYLHACVYDQCSGQLPSSELHPGCVIAQAYATRCLYDHWVRPSTSPVSSGLVENWWEEVGCPSPEEKFQPILDTGCPQPSLEQESQSGF